VKTLVFAFGSNLHLGQMVSRCPSTTFYDRARLADHRLTFAGWSDRWESPVATVKPRKGHSVHGVVYQIDAKDLVALDRAEGAPHVYARESIKVTLASGKRARACTYQLVRFAEEEFEPSDAYLGRIVAGLIFWHLPMKPFWRTVARLSLQSHRATLQK
jgi:gamma-glutamylcyclotransferase (GGCT)/AIG2-like uncharacterized protein YtfP